MTDRWLRDLLQRLDAAIQVEHIYGAHCKTPYKESEAWRECELPRCRRMQAAWTDVPYEPEKREPIVAPMGRVDSVNSGQP